MGIRSGSGHTEHEVIFMEKKQKEKNAAPMESNDLALENLMDEFDMTAADLQDLL